MIDETTGEVLDYEERQLMPLNPEMALEAANISNIITGAIPEHLIQLEKLDIPDDEKLELLSLYEGANWQKFSKYTNAIVPILGAIVWYHPPFKSKPNQEGISEVKAGYHKILFLTDNLDSDGIPIVISCSSSSLALHVLAMLRLKGWYVWEKPIRYKFLYDGPGTPYRLLNVEQFERRKAVANKSAK